MSDRFLQLKQKYMATFTQKQLDLKNAWDKKDISILRGLLHKLAGSSGSYGFDEINRLCHRTMDLLENYESKNDHLIDDSLQQTLILLQNA